MRQAGGWRSLKSSSLTTSTRTTMRSQLIGFCVFARPKDEEKKRWQRTASVLIWLGVFSSLWNWISRSVHKTINNGGWTQGKWVDKEQEVQTVRMNVWTTNSLLSSPSSSLSFLLFPPSLALEPNHLLRGWCYPTLLSNPNCQMPHLAKNISSPVERKETGGQRKECALSWNGKSG